MSQTKTQFPLVFKQILQINKKKSNSTEKMNKGYKVRKRGNVRWFLNILKRCSSSLQIREVQIKTTARQHFSPTKWQGSAMSVNKRVSHFCILLVCPHRLQRQQLVISINWRCFNCIYSVSHQLHSKIVFYRYIFSHVL